MLERQGQFNQLARGERFGKLWFLKGIKPEFADKKLYRDLLRKEFDIAMHLRHPNIVGVVSIENIEKLGTCIVEEWIDGTTLLQWLKNGHSLDEKINILHQLMAAIAHCHNYQVVHRDLKPSNIMITLEDNSLKLIDFGLSDTDSYSSLKAAAGTVNYIAPEVLETKGAIDARADIFSLGMIMKDMDLPKIFNDVIVKATAANPAQRYSTLSQLQEAFNQAATKSRKNRTMALVSVAIAMLCSIAFLGGYNLNFNDFKPQLATSSQSSSIPGWQRGDSLTLARDTSLMVIDVPEKRFSVFLPHPGTDKIPCKIPESEAIDMGLNVDWAPFNVGAQSPCLMMPGVMINGGMENPFTVLHGYCFGDHSSHRTESFEGTRFDAARKLWGGKWRLPLVEDFKELVDKCQWKFTNEPGTIPGYIVTGPSGNSIFLPLAGFRYDRRYFSTGYKGYYWTANRTQPKEEDSVGIMAFIITDDMIFFQSLGVLNGFSIRPVIDKKPHKINDFYNQPSENEPNKP
ncbi:MAG: protein kinase [Muribaculaceae bacterium]|nr:protein kinase [Muribaculaceae bacterium]